MFPIDIKVIVILLSLQYFLTHYVKVILRSYRCYFRHALPLIRRRCLSVRLTSVWNIIGSDR